MSIREEMDRQKKISQIMTWVAEDSTIGRDVLDIVIRGLRMDADSWRKQAMEMETIAVWEAEGPKLRGRGAPETRKRWAAGKIEKLQRFQDRLFFNWDDLLGPKTEAIGQIINKSKEGGK